MIWQLEIHPNPTPSVEARKLTSKHLCQTMNSLFLFPSSLYLNYP